MTSKNDILTGTVKGPGILPHEYLFITRDNNRTRIGEFVYYEAMIGDERRQIVGTINSRKLVRNLPDGRVQLEVEGRAAEVAAFVTAVEERMHGYIRKTERTARTAAPQFTGFAIQ